MLKNVMQDYYKNLNLLYLEKAVDIERTFSRNIVYLSLASIIFSLLFIQHIYPSLQDKGGLHCIPILFFSWGFYFLTIADAAIMLFFGAKFKDVMFEESIKAIAKNEVGDCLYEGRTDFSGSVVYISALIGAILFLIALGLLLLFVGLNISQL